MALHVLVASATPVFVFPHVAHALLVSAQEVNVLDSLLMRSQLLVAAALTGTLTTS